MPRSIVFLVLILLLLVGGAVFLSSNAREVPVKPVEVEVSRDPSQ